MSMSGVILTDAAAQKVKALMDEEENPNLKLRVYITGGGCSGFQYGFTFEESINDDDLVVEKIVDSEDDGDVGGSTTIQLLVDPLSLQYLDGATIDYKTDVQGERFTIDNPNAQTTCGCGSSFSA